jgi:hypothetical protein
LAEEVVEVIRLNELSLTDELIATCVLLHVEVVLIFKNVDEAVATLLLEVDALMLVNLDEIVANLLLEIFVFKDVDTAVVAAQSPVTEGTALATDAMGMMIDP